MNRVATAIGAEVTASIDGIRRHRLQAAAFGAIALSGFVFPLLAGLHVPYAANPVTAAMAVVVLTSPFLLLAAVLWGGVGSGQPEKIDIAYGATVLVSTIWFVGSWGDLHPTRPFVDVLALFYLYLLVRWLGTRFPGDRTTLFANLVVAAAVAEMIYGLAQRSAGSDMRGHFEQANALGMFLGLAVPLALSQVVTRFHGLFYRVLFAGVTGALLWATVLTRCRTAMVGLAFILPLMLIYYARPLLLPAGRRLFSLLTGGVAAVTLSVLALVAAPLYEWSPVSVWGRILAWKMGLSMIGDAPLLGHGFDKSWRVLLEYQGRYFSAGGGNDLERLAAERMGSLMNEYLETAADFGLLGLLFFLPFWLLAARAGFGMLAALDTPAGAGPGRSAAGFVRSALRGLPAETSLFGLGGSVLLFMAMSLTYCTSHFRALGITFTAFLALGVCRLAAASRPAAEALPPGGLQGLARFFRSRPVTAGLLAAGLALSTGLAFQGWREKEGVRQQRVAARLWEAGNTEGALARFGHAYPALRYEAKRLHEHGARLVEAGRFKEALKILGEAQALRRDPYTLEEIARAHAGLGDLGSAIEAGEQARSMLPWRLTVKRMLADYYEQAGRPDKALDLRRELLITPLKIRNQAGMDLKREIRQRLAEAAPVAVPPPSLPDSLPPETCRRLETQLLLAGHNRGELVRAFGQLEPEHYPALEFLIANMPETDLVSLTAEFLVENVRLAAAVRDRLPYVNDTPEQIYLNYVLPYSQAGETRDRWRVDFRDRFSGLVADAPTLEAAVVRLNEEIYERLGVDYGSGGRKLAQSPFEATSSGAASCYGLSILLANACRAVGIPARITTIPRWVGIAGSHGWVEVYDRDRWRFIGAFDRSPLDDTWFRRRASLTDPSNPIHRIYASSFARTDTQTAQFGANVWWTDVTGFYTSLPPLEDEPDDE